jgi:hypothetical protein
MRALDRAEKLLTVRASMTPKSSAARGNSIESTSMSDNESHASTLYHYTDAAGLEFFDPEEFGYGWVSDPAKAMKLVIGTMS